VKRCEHESSQFGQCALTAEHDGPHGARHWDINDVTDQAYWTYWIACTESGDGCIYGDHAGLSELLKTTAVEG
jgi:hypothetical protein